jgi:hypothetical protein
MKSLKAAAIVAGSLVVAGLATPAVAADLAGGQPDLNGNVRNLTQGVKAPGLDGQKLLDTKSGLVPKAVEKTTGTVGNGRPVR